MTLPSANQFPAISYKNGITDKVYPTTPICSGISSTIIKAELAALVNDGVQYMQIDAPRYSYYIDPKWRDWIRNEMDVDPDAALDEAIRADNACFRRARHRRRSLLAIHLCRGNNRSHWYAEGGYDAIAEKLFGTLDVDRFLLEYDDERSGTFEPLRFVPQGKDSRAGTRQQQACRSWNRRRCSRGGSKKRASTCRWKIWRSVRNAASPRPRKATCSPRKISGPSCSWLSKLPGAFGTRSQRFPKNYCHSEERSDEEPAFRLQPAKSRFLASFGMTNTKSR